jgi:ABC-type transporter Mla maintaining outer membrane lipid asymmetry ATPase subunit MlaF
MNERELTRQRLRFGFVFQQAALFDSMTVAQNVAFPLRQHTAKTDRKSSRSCSPGWPRSACPKAC